MDLIQEQHDIEISMANRGIDRYRRAALEAAQGGEATRTKSVQVVMDTAILAVTEAIDAFRAAATTGKAGRRHSALKLIDGMGSDELAYFALRITLDGLAKDRVAFIGMYEEHDVLEEFRAKAVRYMQIRPTALEDVLHILEGAA